MIDNKKLIAQFKLHKETAYRALREQKQEFELDYDFYAGNRKIYKTGVTEKVTKMVNVNRVKPFVDAVNGFTIQNRRQPIYHASVMDNQEQRAISGYTNSVAKYFRDNANFDQVESEQDLDLYIAGLGATDTNVTYNDYAATTDPYGEIVKERLCNIKEVWWDAAAKSKNLLDATYVFRCKKFHIEQAKDLFDQPENVFTSVGDDGKATGYFYDPISNTRVSLDMDKVEKDMVNVYYYQWYEINKYCIAENPLPQIAQINPTLSVQLLRQLEVLQRLDREKQNVRVEEQEDIFDLKPDAEDLIIPSRLKRAVIDIFANAGFNLQYTEGKRKEYFTAIISGEKIFDKFKSIDQTGFSIKFKTGTYDVNTGYWSGLVKSLREPSMFLNKITTEILNIIAASPKPGVLYEDGAVEDPVEFEQSYALNGSAIRVAAGALTNGQIRDKQIGTNISGYSEMYALFKQGLNESLGIGDVFFGMLESKEETAALQRQRIKRTLSLLAHYFDSITLYQKEDAKGMLPLLKILAGESQQRLFAIAGENGVVEFQQLSDNQFADRYEISIGEAPDTDTAKQDAIDATTSLADRLLGSGDPKLISKGEQMVTLIYDLLPNISNDLKKKVTSIMSDPEPTPEQIEAQQKQQALQEQAALLELQDKQADIESKVAKTNESEAKVRESESKIMKNLSDTEHTAVETEIMERQSDKEFSNNIII